MSLEIKYLDTAQNEFSIDLAKYDYDKDYLHIEFAKIVLENAENGEIEELEVCSRLKLPIENALQVFAGFISALVNHEKEHNTGYGLILPEPEESD